MNQSQNLFREGADLYEEVLVSQSLDQYEGLLLRSKSNRKTLKNSKDISDIIDCATDVEK